MLAVVILWLVRVVINLAAVCLILVPENQYEVFIIKLQQLQWAVC